MKDEHTIPDLMFVGWDAWVEKYKLPRLWKDYFPETISDSTMEIVECPTDKISHFTYEGEP
ncbi:MAG: hypothetical protein M0R06_07495 [Sphaerochaeta sp.]|jgi:hypothetical protein|nr:hypothetical protein [Sphaerochaeta sp.]